MHLICYSHLRWRSIFQRPQHILTRLASFYNVHYVEEPVFDSLQPWLETASIAPGITLLVPHLSEQHRHSDGCLTIERLLSGYIYTQQITEHIAWYYTPMALDYSRSLNPALIVYDCMDELSAFKDAPFTMQAMEDELFEKADLVFAGGYSLYKRKKTKHPNVHLFRSSVDQGHFKKARTDITDPPDQQLISRPRIGFFGAIDERLDTGLLTQIAQLKPQWQFILIGPVVKIHPSSLPQYRNIHYLGQKSYEELPAYISGWDMAFMPFAMNASTLYISPTKTPEFLSAGKQVVSTPIADVVKDYGSNGAVSIASTASEFVHAIEKSLADTDNEKWLQQVDLLLADNSWDVTTWKIYELIKTNLARRYAKLS